MPRDQRFWAGKDAEVPGGVATRLCTEVFFLMLWMGIACISESCKLYRSF